LVFFFFKKNTFDIFNYDWIRLFASSTNLLSIGPLTHIIIST